MKTIKAIHIDENDNCVTLTGFADTGDSVTFLAFGEERAVTARGNTPVWHKMSIKPVKKGDNVYKYGAVIGTATKDIEAGEHIHIHNIRSPGYAFEVTEAGD